jgi:DNA adenine methylase
MSRNFNSEYEGIVPFLKWAGGKRWLWPQLQSLLQGVSFTRYVEPFLGSGAIYFALEPHTALLNDANQELVACYRAIKAAPTRVVAALECYAASHSDRFYYAVRDTLPEDRFERAARFLYLNRTCWNGLYRVNLRGEFNVPRGTKNQVLMPTDDFDEVAELLQGADLWDGDLGRRLRLCVV